MQVFDRIFKRIVIINTLITSSLIYNPIPFILGYNCFMQIRLGMIDYCDGLVLRNVHTSVCGIRWKILIEIMIFLFNSFMANGHSFEYSASKSQHQLSFQFSIFYHIFTCSEK